MTTPSAVKRFRTTFGNTDCEVHIYKEADHAGQPSLRAELFAWVSTAPVGLSQVGEFLRASEAVLLNDARRLLVAMYGGIQEPWADVTSQPERARRPF